MLMSFLQFINEEYDDSSNFINDLALKLLKKIQTNYLEESDEYSSFSGMEFTTPFAFDLKLDLRRSSNPSIETDSHFKGLPWEEINYSEDGYAIDANARTNPNDLLIPEIKIVIILNPKEEPHVYTKLHARLIDILTHETNHLNQIGINDTPVNSLPSKKDAMKDIWEGQCNDLKALIKKTFCSIRVYLRLLLFKFELDLARFLLRYFILLDETSNY
jgi:hypothetical protein